MRKMIIFLVLCSIASAQNPYRSFNNFNAGELTPLLNAREDLAKFQNGCSIMENLIPIPQGGAQKRPGTKYIAEVKTSSLATRILPFEFSTSQSYVVEVGNQYMRFYTSGAQVASDGSSETTAALPETATIKAHWKMNEITGTTVEDFKQNHDGTASVDTSILTAIGKANRCFDFAVQYEVIVSDDDDFTFTSTAFSISAWIFVIISGNEQHIISKYSGTDLEWQLHLDDTPTTALTLQLDDDSASKLCKRSTDAGLTAGWHHIVATYDGSEGATAADGITFYVDGDEVVSTATNNASYVTMDNTPADVSIGSLNGSLYFEDKIDNLILWKGTELTSANVDTLYLTDQIIEVETPYLTADLFELKYEQSADVLYITHPDYETRKLSRIANDAWAMDAIGIETGPFRTENIDVAKTITANGTTGSVTLTAVGHAPFVLGTTAGHLPSGTGTTNKSNTGALFKLVHPLTTLSFSDTLEDDTGASSAEGTSWMSCGTLYQGTAWTWITGGTWLGQVAVQRNYTIGAAFADSGWDTVLPFDGVSTARNVSTSGTEDDGDADYRVAFLDDTSGTVISYFTTDQIGHVGIVEITAVASPTSATATVLTTIASTNATHKWSEGSWSNYRGWPQTVTFFEDRLTFGGNTAQPDTIWASVTSDYENMTAGPDDDEALLFTLSSRQVNVIEWIIGKDKLLIGTSGAEWTIAGGTDEPLTPSNAIAKQHSTYGSASLQAGIANESILFFQRGAKKMRELAYNWELDSYVAPDMTILANLVTGSGVIETAFQKTPDSILWCIRTDGELPVFSYERKENITAWSRMITHTNLAGTLTDSDFESVARISGNPEDEVWVVVERTINSSTVRYIEQFQPRDFGTDADDAFYVDAGVTYDSAASSAMTGLDHLDGQTVYVLADGVIFDTEVVVGGAITLSLDNVTTTASTVQMGLGYEVHMRTMPLSWLGGQTIQGLQKRISEVVANWYVSGDFSIGRDADTLGTMSVTGQTTSQDRITFPPGYDYNGYVYVYQKSPEPLTLLGLALEFDVN